MKTIMILGLMLVFLGVATANPITECMDITESGSYAVMNEINAGGEDCFVITAENVQVNCRNHTITNSMIGFDVRGNNVKIEDCVLKQTNLGILAWDVENMILMNNRLIGGAYGIILFNTQNSWLTFNVVGEFSNVGISLTDGSNDNLLTYNAMFENGLMDLQILRSNGTLTRDNFLDKVYYLESENSVFSGTWEGLFFRAIRSSGLLHNSFFNLIWLTQCHWQFENVGWFELIID